MGIEYPRILADEVEHPWLFLRGKQQWLHGDRRTVRNNSLKFLEDALCVSEIRDHKSSHVSQGRNGFDSRLAAGLLKIKQNRQIFELTNFLSNGVENRFSL